MTQSADGPEAVPQPPHAPVQADEQAGEASSADGDQSAGDGQDAGQPPEAAGADEAAPGVQHPSFDDAQVDPWGQEPVGEYSAPTPPWYGQGNGTPEQQAADPYYQGQVPGPFGQDQPHAPDNTGEPSGGYAPGAASAPYGQDHSRGAEGYTPGSFGQDPGPGPAGQGYPQGRFGQKQVPAVDADDYPSGQGHPGQGHPGPGQGQGQQPLGADRSQGPSGYGQAPETFGAHPPGSGAHAPYEQGQPQDAAYGGEYGREHGGDYGQGYVPAGYEQEGEPYPQDPGYQQPPQQGLRPEVVNPFLEQSNAIPRRGMRRAVYRATFGAVNLGPSEEERAGRARRQRVERPLHGSWRVVVMSIKGGVGKTTTAAMLGRTLAEWRGDRVVALDTNPDMGTLGDRLVGATDVTVRGLLAHEARAPIQQVAEVNRFTNLAGRLHVLANEQDPAVSEDFTGSEYQQTLNILERFYNVIIADCGTGVLRPWVRDMLALANTLVVVAEPKGDAATRAAGTLDWIAQHGFHDLVARSVAVINYRSPTPKSLDVDALTSFFAQRCRAVCKIRYDEHLDLGVQIQYDPIPDAPAEAYVADATKEDYLELAAIIADEFR